MKERQSVMSLAAILIGVSVIVLFFALVAAFSARRRRGQQPTGSPPR
jgi:heme/copper-type cytochrome/quinol oxidase subunit 2